MKFGQEIDDMEQEKKQLLFDSRLIYKVATGTSFACSFVGVILLIAILFVPGNIDHKIIQMADYFAHALLFAAVILGFLAIFLSKSDSKQTDSASIASDPLQKDINRGHNAQRHASGTKTSYSMNCRRTLTSCVDEDKPSEVKTLVDVPEKFQSTYKDSKNSSSCINYGTKRRSSLEASKFSASSDSGNCKVPCTGNELVPVKKRKEFPSFNRSFAAPSQVPNLRDSISSDNSRNDSVTEFVASRKIRLFSEGDVQSQEELEMKRITTVFRRSEVAVPSIKVPGIDLNEDNKHELRRRFFLSQPFSEPQNDHVSDVITKLESLQFLY